MYGSWMILGGCFGGIRDGWAFTQGARGALMFYQPDFTLVSRSVVHMSGGLGGQLKLWSWGNESGESKLRIK